MCAGAAEAVPSPANSAAPVAAATVRNLVNTMMYLFLEGKVDAGDDGAEDAPPHPAGAPRCHPS
jgi:hypothetical protein